MAADTFPVKVLHGLYDIVAAPRHAARLAQKLAAPLVMLDSAHFMTRDCVNEVSGGMGKAGVTGPSWQGVSVVSLVELLLAHMQAVMSIPVCTAACLCWGSCACR